MRARGRSSLCAFSVIPQRVHVEPGVQQHFVPLSLEDSYRIYSCNIVHFEYPQIMNLILDVKKAKK
ncbi:hypothetical protein JZ751_001512 [Albula glossodonta]|uniref:Uncharacterized protein n=1 Tax=Albula glossodonta TaxID=121402 RepID=A0A8T2PTY1_9TELE|nr:hypothetical protein JZ751_001512 [Albula glossodonta]